MRPAAVDEQLLSGDGAAGFAGEEDGNIGDLGWLEQMRYALRAADDTLHCGRDEFL